MSHEGGAEKAQERWPLLVIAAFVLSYLATGFFTLDETGRRVPLIAGAVTLILVIAEMLRVRLRPDGTDTPHVAEGGGVMAGAPPGREILAIIFVAAGVAAIILLGFLLAIPLYLFVSIAYLGKQSLRTAAIVSVISSLTIYLVFEVVLSYRLFPGWLFS